MNRKDNIHAYISVNIDHMSYIYIYVYIYILQGIL